MRIVLPILAVSVGSQPASAESFRIDEAASDVYVQIAPDPGTLLSGLSHEHVIVARRLEGEVRWNPERPEDCWVEVEVPVSGLEVDPEAKRKSLGFDKELSDDNRKKVDRNMRAKNQMWAERYPTVRFRAARCRAEGDETIRVDGALTIRGVSKNVSLPVKVSFDERGLRAQVDFRRVHADFGFSPYSNLLGALKNDDALRFHVDIRATRTSTQAETTPSPSDRE